MNLHYYYLYMQSCFGRADPETGLITTRYNSFNVNRAFDYQNMNRLLLEQGVDSIECQGYQAFINDLEASFIFLQRLPDEPSDPNNFTMGTLASTQNTGWKFHILIADDPENNNLERGWSILKDELIRHQIHYTKIIQQPNREALRSDPEQKNKVITVYAFKENKTPQEWQQFIYDVSTSLRRNNIQASPAPVGESQINNTEYFSYRNDGRPSADPFENIDGRENLRPTQSRCFK